MNFPVLPEMVFGHSFLKIEHESGFTLELNAFDALNTIDNADCSHIPKVPYAEKWLKRYLMFYLWKKKINIQ